jgi:hypothetical protein
MNYNTLIKMSLNDDFEENKNYQLLLEYNKISNLISLENNYNECDSILKEFDGKIIEMKYVGISRIDSKKIFLIDIKSVRRDLSIKELGL